MILGGGRRHRGATLLELIAVIVLLAVVIPPLLAWVNTALRGVGLESESVRVAQLGQRGLEVLLTAKRDGRLDFSDADAFQQSCEDALQTFDGATGLEAPAGYALDIPRCLLIDDERGELRVTSSGPGLSRQYVLEVYDLD